MSSESDATLWDERYRSQAAVWSGNPNIRLVEEVSELAPGSALDVGCGEGADAIWLAERGWRVTAADISSVALERARTAEMSVDAAGRIDWLHIDLVKCDPPAPAYDLVSAHFMHLPKEPRDVLFRRLAALVKPGGTLLVVGHHPSDLQTTARRPRRPGVLYTAADIAALLEPGDWDVIVNEARERSTTDPDGRTITIHDAVLRARRHG
jgi:SAM-dependent methyltransferase